jgi:hypothetical protein
LDEAECHILVNGSSGCDSVEMIPFSPVCSFVVPQLEYVDALLLWVLQFLLALSNGVGIDAAEPAAKCDAIG